MNKNIDIYQDKAIREKENKELEHFDELIKGEGTTMYGEFISSYFAWTGLNRQKTRAEELNEMAKRKK